MSCNNPVTTSLCIENNGTFCQSEVESAQTVLASSETNTVVGTGNPSIPYQVITVVSPTAGNALTATSSGLYVSNAGSTNYTFSNTGFDI